MGRNNGYNLTALRWRNRHWPGNEGYLGTCLDSGGGQTKAHLAGAVIADIADWIQGFSGWTCSNHYFFACQQPILKHATNLTDNTIGLFHSSGTNISTGLNAFIWPNHSDTALFECFDIGETGGMAPHGLVHRWGHGYLCWGCQMNGSEQAVGFAVNHIGNKISTCWGY